MGKRVIVKIRRGRGGFPNIVVNLFRKRVVLYILIQVLSLIMWHSSNI